MKQALSHFLRREPIPVDDRNWMYVDPKGILFVHEVLDKSFNLIKTDQIDIPWSQVRLALKEYEKGKELQSNSTPKG